MPPCAGDDLVRLWRLPQAAALSRPAAGRQTLLRRRGQVRAQRLRVLHTGNYPRVTPTEAARAIRRSRTAPRRVWQSEHRALFHVGHRRIKDERPHRLHSQLARHGRSLASLVMASKLKPFRRPSRRASWTAAYSAAAPSLRAAPRSRDQHFAASKGGPKDNVPQVCGGLQR